MPSSVVSMSRLLPTSAASRPPSLWPCAGGAGPARRPARRVSSGSIRPALDRPALGRRQAAVTFSGGSRRIAPGDLHCTAELPELVDIATAAAAIYGASLLGGGLFAFTRTGSKGSLGGGLTGGVLLGAAFLLMQGPETRELGNALGLGAAALFASVFGIRLAATRKVVPSGVLLGMSSLASLIFATAYFQARL